MEMFLPLLLLLAAARVGGEIAHRLNQASLVGEILGGVVLGIVLRALEPSIPAVGNLLGNPAVDHIVDLGIFFLILSAGIEMQPREIVRGSVTSFSVAVGGMVVPFAAGAGFAWLALPDSPLKPVQVMAVGVALSISAVPATMEILRELGLLHHRVGRTVVSAAIFDDVFGLLLLAVLIALIRTQTLPDASALLLLLGKAALFFVLAILANLFFYKFVAPILHIGQSAVITMSAIVLGALALSVLAEALGLHFIMGPFIVGLFFERSRVGRSIYRQTDQAVDLVGHGFFVPIFFAVVGARLDLAAFSHIPGAIVLLIIIAILGKVLGAGLPALAAGMNRRDSLAVGTAMSARGMVELVVLAIAFKAGVFDDTAAPGSLAANLFSALVIMAVVTTVVAPVLLRLVLARPSKDPPKKKKGG